MALEVAETNLSIVGVLLGVVHMDFFDHRFLHVIVLGKI